MYKTYNYSYINATSINLYMFLNLQFIGLAYCIPELIILSVSLSVSLFVTRSRRCLCLFCFCYYCWLLTVRFVCCFCCFSVVPARLVLSADSVQITYFLLFACSLFRMHILSHTHTHTHIWELQLCVCVCVSIGFCRIIVIILFIVAVL